MPADGQVARGMRSSPIGSTSRVPYGEGSWPRPPILRFIETIVRMRQFFCDPDRAVAQTDP
jgi:hypothetical protein